jgi:hypothetical protein
MPSTRTSSEAGRNRHPKCRSPASDPIAAAGMVSSDPARRSAAAFVIARPAGARALRHSAPHARGGRFQAKPVARLRTLLRRSSHAKAQLRQRLGGRQGSREGALSATAGVPLTREQRPRGEGDFAQLRSCGGAQPMTTARSAGAPRQRPGLRSVHGWRVAMPASDRRWGGRRCRWVSPKAAGIPSRERLSVRDHGSKYLVPLQHGPPVPRGRRAASGAGRTRLTTRPKRPVAHAPEPRGALS